MGFLPDFHPYKLMINYSMIKLPSYPLYISMLYGVCKRPSRCRTNKYSANSNSVIWIHITDIFFFLTKLPAFVAQLVFHYLDLWKSWCCSVGTKFMHWMWAFFFNNTHSIHCVTGLCISCLAWKAKWIFAVQCYLLLIPEDLTKWDRNSLSCLNLTPPQVIFAFLMLSVKRDRKMYLTTSDSKKDTIIKIFSLEMIYTCLQVINTRWICDKSLMDPLPNKYN